jgi:hypothetical protein
MVIVGHSIALWLTIIHRRTGIYVDRRWWLNYHGWWLLWLVVL